MRAVRTPISAIVFRATALVVTSTTAQTAVYLSMASAILVNAPLTTFRSTMTKRASSTTKTSAKEKLPETWRVFSFFVCCMLSASLWNT
jgi:hypothetical protein